MMALRPAAQSGRPFGGWQAAPAAGSYDGESDFPIDDLPPDDLPVRDIAEDHDEQHPTHSMAIRAADLAVVISRTLFMIEARTVPSPERLSPAAANLPQARPCTLSLSSRHLRRTRSRGLKLRSRRPSTFCRVSGQAIASSRDSTPGESTPCALVGHAAHWRRRHSRPPRLNYGRMV